MIRLKVPDGRPPWAIDAFTTTGGVGSFGTSSQMLFDMWEGNEKFRQQVLDELIKDCIHVEVAGIASATLAVNTAHYRGQYIQPAFRQQMFPYFDNFF